MICKTTISRGRLCSSSSLKIDFMLFSVDHWLLRFQITAIENDFKNGLLSSVCHLPCPIRNGESIGVLQEQKVYKVNAPSSSTQTREIQSTQVNSHYPVPALACSVDSLLALSMLIFAGSEWILGDQILGKKEPEQNRHANGSASVLFGS